MQTTAQIPNPATWGRDVPDLVLVWVVLAAVVVLAWFALKAGARGGHLVGWYERLDPAVQAGRRWVAGAPAVFTYMTIWTVTSVIQQGQPAALADLSARLASTSIHNLLNEPARVLFSSAFLVAENAFLFLAYVPVFVLIAARLEHRLGAARWIVVAASAHVLGSILTVLVEHYGIAIGVLPASIRLTQDVGVSYVMVGSLGAYLWLVTDRWRRWYFLAVALGILGPLIVTHTIWDLGHFLATGVGAVSGWIVMRWPLRDPMVWRDLVGALPARALPTFDATLHRPLPEPEVTGRTSS